MGQTTIVLMIITILSKIFGFVRESVMAAFIGAGELKSIYTTAMTIPAMLVGVVANGIVSGYIPIYSKIVEEEGEDSANRFTYNLINILMIFGFLIFLLIFFFASPICKILSPDLTGESLKLAVNYTRIIMISIFMLLYSCVIKGFLNTKGNFIDPAFTGIILNIIIIISVILSYRLDNLYILIVGALLGYIIQFIRFPFVSRKLGFKYKVEVDFSDKFIKMIFIMMVPILISSAADQISLAIDNSMASAFFGISSISKIYYSKTLLNFIMTVVTLSVVTVTFPDIAKLGQSGDIVGMKEKLSSSIVFSMILVIPATFGMMALSNPIVKLAFERNAFTSMDTEIVASLIVAYGPYIIFASLIKILSNGFYSIGDSKTPFRIVMIQQLANLLMNYVLSKLFGLNGLAYSTSVSTLISSVLLIIVFSKKVGRFDDKDNMIVIVKIFISSVVMSGFAICLYKIVSFSLIINLFLSVIASGLVYILMLKILKVKEFDIIAKKIKKKIK